jgi:hydrogenase maturation protein HypF
VIESVSDLYHVTPACIVADLHPEYISTKYAKQAGTDVIQVQHHHAHVASCIAENQISGPLLGIAWDGTGLGVDGTIWGGEFFRVDKNDYKRVGTFRSFKLPGGEQAIREPWRIALGLLVEIYGQDFTEIDFLPAVTFKSEPERNIILKMLEKNINTPITSSAGRLFDAVTSLIGIRQIMSFEGQAAMELEFAIADTQSDEAYEIRLIEPSTDSHPLQIDWEPMIVGIINDVKLKKDRSLIAVKFHNTMAEGIIRIAKMIGEQRVALSGGCFQNKYLTERVIARLVNEGFQPYWHQRVPPNDGGIALGQLVIAGARNGY